MKKQIQSTVLNGNQQVGIKCTVLNNGQNEDEFIVPVLYSTRSDSERAIVNNQIRLNNKNKGSKFMKPSFSVMGHSYQESYKK